MKFCKFSSLSKKSTDPKKPNLLFYKGHAEIVKYLIEEVENFPEPRDNFLQTPLHEAARRGKYLLK